MPEDSGAVSMLRVDGGDVWGRACTGVSVRGSMGTYPTPAARIHRRRLPPLAVGGISPACG